MPKKNKKKYSKYPIDYNKTTGLLIGSATVIEITKLFKQ